MTPSMGMAAPKGTQAPAAGLAAIAQPAQAPKGMTSGNMAQVMAMARKMSDGQLAEVLQGKSLSVPQYVAMTEAMGRKSLRTAMDGQQSMAQAKQPSVKDKLLMGDQPQMPQMPQMPQQPVMAAEGGMMYADGGIADLPAPNMESMDMASGGIIAFNGENNRQLVTEEDFQRLVTGKGMPLTEEQKEKLANTPNIFKNIGKSQRSVAAEKSQKTAMDEAIAAAPRTTPSQAIVQDIQGSSQGPQTVLTSAPAVAAPSVVGGAAAPARVAAAAPAVVPDASQTDSGIGSLKSYTDAIKANREDYYKKVEGLGAKQREGLAQLRRQGGGEALMAISRGLLSKGTLAQGVAEGLPGVMAAATGSRKEQRAVESLANEYDINMAKSRAADAKGDMESALMFKKMADEANYRKEYLGIQRAQLNKPDSGIAMLNALKDPANMAIFKDMSAAKKGEIYSIDKATDDFNKIVGDKFGDQAKRLKTLGITNPYQYQQYVLSQSGGGTDLASQAAAILASRGK